MKALVAAFKDATPLTANGIYVAGAKYAAVTCNAHVCMAHHNQSFITYAYACASFIFIRALHFIVMCTCYVWYGMGV